MWPYAWVFLGAGLGGTMRHGVNRAAAMLFGTHFPAGTFCVNIIGSLLMGLLAGWFAFRGEATNQALRLFLTTGLLGGFTTFSAFSLDATLMWQRGDGGLTIAYIFGSVILSMVGVFAGLAVMRGLLA